MSNPSTLFNEQELESSITYDQKLDLLVNSTGEVKQIANEIGQRLDESNLEFADINQKMTTVKNDLDNAVDRLQNLTTTKSGCLAILSFVLTLVAIFLFFYAVI